MHDVLDPQDLVPDEGDPLERHVGGASSRRARDRADEDVGPFLGAVRGVGGVRGEDLAGRAGPGVRP